MNSLEKIKTKNLKIAYYVQTDIQHVPPVMCLYPYFGGTIYTKREHIYNFIKEKYPEVSVKYFPTRPQIRKELLKQKIRLMIYPSYVMLKVGKSVQIFHGASDKTYEEHPKIMLYDLVLFPGEKTKKKVENAGYLGKIPHWKIVGYPKFDKLINSRINAPSLFKNSRPVILYAPTWISTDSLTKWNFSEYGESSLPLWGKELIRNLHKDFNIIIKYHNRAYRKKGDIYDQINELIEKLHAEKHVKCIWDDNILPYMKIADLMITDISTVCYEWFHFNKPILYANPAPWHYSPSTDIYSNTYAWQAGDVINRKEDIMPLVQKNLKSDKYKEIRNKIFRESFFQPDGKASERSAEAIYEYYMKLEKFPFWFLQFISNISRRIRSFPIKFFFLKEKIKKRGNK